MERRARKLPPCSSIPRWDSCAAAMPMAAGASRFDEFEWGGPFIEGGPWQHTFHVPLRPGRARGALWRERGPLPKLDAMVHHAAAFHHRRLSCEIHEMTEMAMADFGQYAHSNQPVHHFPMLYAHVGQPEKAAHWIHRVANELYSVGEFPGDEDNGEMAAWHALACLGLFPHVSGHGGFVEVSAGVMVGKAGRFNRR